MFYFRTGTTKLPASFTGRKNDKDWDMRESKTVILSVPFDYAEALFHDDMEWYIVEETTYQTQKTDENGEPMWDENGEPIMEDETYTTEYDNSAFSMVGDIIKHYDNTTSVKMGKPTELEEAYKLLYGGI